MEGQLRRSTRRKVAPSRATAKEEVENEEAIDVYSEPEVEERSNKVKAKDKTVRPRKRPAVSRKSKKDETLTDKAGKERFNKGELDQGKANQGGFSQEELEYLEISINDPHKAEEERDEGSCPELRDPVRSKNSPYDRNLRLAMRHLHLACLLISFSIKSKIAGSKLYKSMILSIVPPHLQRQFTKEIIEDGRTVNNAINMLSNWWRNRMRNDNNGGRREIYSGLQLNYIFSQFENYILLKNSKRIADEDLVIVFACLLRGFGFKTRFVCSIQPILLKPIKRMAEDDSDKVPIFWCEIFHPLEKRWITVDCLRAIINDRLAMEPPQQLFTKIGRQNLFVIGFDEEGKAFDLTRRYSSKYFGWNSKLRKSDEACLFDILKFFGGKIEASEEDELSSLVDGELFPTTVAGFQGHGRYMLERQLKKYEVFWPLDQGIVGEFRGENIRLRSAVKKVKSKDAWYTQFGRVIKEGETPCKFVKLPKKPQRKSMKKKIEGWEKELAANERSITVTSAVGGDDEEEEEARPLQPLYGEWQTEPYSPPRAEDGIVPRNKFGNVDLYLPSMLPIGCVWINDELAWEAASQLKIDYAAACVRFAFSGRYAVPNLRGVVICEEYEGELLRELERIKIEREIEIRESLLNDQKERKKLESKKKRIMKRIVEEHEITSDQDEDIKTETRISSVFSRENSANGNTTEDFDDLF